MAAEDTINSYYELAREGVGTVGGYINPIFSLAHGVGKAGENAIAIGFSDAEQGSQVGKGIFDPLGGLLKDVEEGDALGAVANLGGLGWLKNWISGPKRDVIPKGKIQMGLSDRAAGYKEGDLEKEYTFKRIEKPTQERSELSDVVSGLTTAATSYLSLASSASSAVDTATTTAEAVDTGTKLGQTAEGGLDLAINPNVASTVNKASEASKIAENVYKTPDTLNNTFNFAKTLGGVGSLKNMEKQLQESINKELSANKLDMSSVGSDIYQQVPELSLKPNANKSNKIQLTL